jgi:hypothetical protein
MIRAAKIALVVMGGGLVMSAVYAHHQQTRRCAEARRQNLPDAEQICARSSSSWSWHSHSSYGSSSSSYGSGSSSSSATSVARGGFGAAGAHFASSGG